ncbi:MAG: BBP7 family outer membrane beta-barrel protein [Planctomycetota bacterium]|jgi:hypothetical protein
MAFERRLALLVMLAVGITLLLGSPAMAEDEVGGRNLTARVTVQDPAGSAATLPPPTVTGGTTTPVTYPVSYPGFAQPPEPPPPEPPVAMPDVPPTPAPMPEPTPIIVVPQPPPPTRAQTEQVIIEVDECCQARDECGWPLDTCGVPYGRLDITLEGLYTMFDDPSGVLGVPPAFVAPGPGVPNAFQWGLTDYDEEFGGRVTIRYAVAPVSYIELRGAWYGEFEGTSRQTGVFGFQPGPAGLGGLSALNTATFDMEADLYTGELNYWTEASCVGNSRFDVGGGVRYVRFEETASAINWALPIVPAAGPASIVSEADNTFVGIQLGGAWHYDFSPTFEFRIAARGLIGNVNQDTTVTDANVLAGGTHVSRVDYDEIRLGADVDVGFFLRLSPRFGVTLGYNMFLLDGVARANNAMDFTQSVSGAVQAAIADDQIVNHSLFLGLNINL